MKYWVYINSKVTGPFTAEQMVSVSGFTPDTLICSEDAANSGNQEWVKASSVFEFEQPAPAQQVTQAPAQSMSSSAAAGATSEGSDALASALLAKLDALTNQLTDMQSKLDGVQGKLDGMQNKIEDMQDKIDNSISTQQQAAQEAAERAEELTRRFNQMTQPIHQDPATSDLAAAAQTPDIPQQETDSPVQTAEPEISHPQENTPEPEQEPARSLSDLDKAISDGEEELEKASDDLVLNSALETLRMPTEQTQDEKENTFQDLLTPTQVASLAQEAKAKRDAAAKEKQAAKDQLVEDLTSPAPTTDVVDQLIQEKEEDEAKKSMTMRILSAGAAVFGLGKKKTETKQQETPKENSAEQKPEAQSAKEQEPAPEGKEPQGISLSEQPAQDQPADIEIVQPSSQEPAEQTPQELPEKQALNFENMEAEPALTIASDEEPKLPQTEEIAPQSQALQTDDVADTSDEESQIKTGERLQATPDNASVLPSLESQNSIGETFMQEQQDLTPEELVPNAKEEKPDELISQADLQIAFADQKTHEEESVEKLFGLASAGGAISAAQEKEDQQTQENDKLPSLDEAVTKPSPAQPDSQESDPNGMSEVELKAGSTYLISDFVPPASSDAKAEPFEEKKPSQEAQDQDGIELQEMVPTAQSVNEEEAPKDAVSDVTVSQIVLENTIKAKRGAALDIKTVPLVPEPAQSDRLQIEGMDDINTQHDIKTAEAEPAGKMVKMIGGTLFALLLAAIIYGMLAFMNLIPQQFNVFAKKQAAEVAQQQDAQINEMLGTEEQLPMPTDAEEPTPATEQDPQAAILTEVKNYMLPNGQTLQAFIEAKHPAAVDLITWDISTAVDPDNYSVLVKVPPENPQSFKISYRFNYNAVTKALDPTISDAKNLLDSAQPQVVQ